MRIWTRGFATKLGGGLRPPSDTSPQESIAPARPALELRRTTARERRPATRAWYADVWIQMLRRKPLGTIGGAILLVMLAAAVLADCSTPYGFAQTSLPERFITTSPAPP